MLSQSAVNEFRQEWLPHITDCGLDYLRGLLDQQSPLLVRGRWIGDYTSDPDVSTFSEGCLATQIAWLHPATAQMHAEAGYRWLNDIVGIEPARSRFMHEWDQGSSQVFAEFAYLLREEQQRRCQQSACDQTEARQREAKHSKAQHSEATL